MFTRFTRPRFRSIVATCTTVLLAAGLLSGAPAQAAGSIDVVDVYTAKARYAPGATVPVVAQLHNTSSSSWSGTVSLAVSHLSQAAGGANVNTTVPAGATTTVTLNWTAPATDFRGYLGVVTADADRAVTAIDVSSTWTRFPRYGYLTDYPVGETPAQATAKVQQLVRDYHLNALQFYDWMWRHEQPVGRENGQIPATWQDWSGITIAPGSVQNATSAAHAAGAAAMPYSMSYAGLQGYEQISGVNPAWGLFNNAAHTQQWQFDFGDADPNTNLWMFNPGNTGWQNYITGEYVDQVNAMGFDGVHLDQLGNWGTRYDNTGAQVPYQDKFRDLINASKAALTANNPAKSTTVFNVVNGSRDGWGTGAVASSNADFLYSELWESATTYAAVKDYVTDHRRDAGGKAMTLAAYMNYGENTGTSSYEAESAARSGVTVNTNHPGYTGSGFVDGFGDVGDWVEFTVTAPETRDYALDFRYANATGAAVERRLLVDGTDQGTVRFHWNPSKTWDTWEYDAYKVVHLTAGTHTIRVRADVQGFINLDNLTLGSFDDDTVRLAGAAFAAVGASHIEMGEGDQMLAHPYFPNHYKQTSNALKAWMRDYYDFTTAYENLIYDATPTDSGNQFVTIAGQPTSGNGQGGTIWTQLSRTSTHDVIHLVNLLGNDGQWRNAAATPPLRTNLQVKYYLGPDATPSGVYVASPDRDHGIATSLPYTTGTDSAGTYVSFTVPELAAWDMIYIPRTFTTPAGNRYEAERATKTAVTVGTNHPGYTGTGFVDNFATAGSGVSFAVNAPATGTYRIRLRYGNGGTAATRLVVADGEVAGTPTFSGQGTWDTWTTLDVTTSLRQGHHTIVVWRGANHAGAINLDHIEVTQTS